MASSHHQRWHLEVAPEDQALIDRAVLASGLSRSDFVLQAARLAAREFLEDQAWCAVGEEPFEQFVACLDAPPQVNDRLRRTMNAPKPWQS